jgi:hypothetical protein
VALEKQIILKEVRALATAAGIDKALDEEAAELLATTYHELREGVSAEGMRIEKPACVMSTAEAISVYYQTLMGAWYYGNGEMDPRALVENLVGAVAKESGDDLDKIGNYFGTVVREKASREGGLWKKYYEARSRLK